MKPIGESIQYCERNPLITIGMPVYNEECFIDAALSSLRQQNYPNLEIVISDNASTDRTVDICKRHLSSDSRIKIHCASKNLGASANFQKTLDLAQGAYFMWAGGHDLWSPNLISECVALLEENKQACLAFGSSRWIGLNSEPLARVSGWSDTRGLDSIGRFFTVLWGNMHPIMGVMRTAALRGCRPLASFAGSDLVLLTELSLRGEFLHAPTACWFRRELRVEMNYDDKLRRYASPDTGIIRSKFGRMFPLLTLPVTLIRVVLRAQLPLTDRFGTLLALVAALPVRYLVGKRGHS